MAPNSPLPLSQSLSSSMGNPATPSSSQRPATPVASPRKVTDAKDVVMGVMYSTWEALHEAEPLDPAVDFEFLIHKFLSTLKLYCQKDWPLPKMPDASMIVKASSHQGDYDEQMHDANTAGSDYAMELELLLDTLIDEYETVIALAPCLYRPPSFLILFLAN
ncbi:uncharacterized protein LAESUDRAFT_754600 [Laetiporus sulphureus 93-53]|uniref:Uncharacterized protein n=1 Tax=Laetiporus sulphureus 93-53 TaxID=1314785 RepID=A0A165HRM5_9APHY|nr:uncharacterized protein LAESUDRAFT_754600 [Laetiporus sulphureus 93-53]KZT12091.1 hypothetical protein LAESUDRAFT_754600 [Laetiporus sulphureus 93-53]